MRIAIGADHAGVALKGELVELDPASFAAVALAVPAGAGELDDVLADNRVDRGGTESGGDSPVRPDVG